VPEPKIGELLVKVHATTINPSDKYLVEGYYFNVPLPVVAGLEGTGVILQVGSENLIEWIGKRVSFKGISGTWAEYSLTKP
jgi:NADPH:quinone reductase-like Zn-dependent oxidoreductase